MPVNKGKKKKITIEFEKEVCYTYTDYDESKA